MSEWLRQKWLTNNVRVWIRRRTEGRCVCVCLHIILPCLSMNEWTLWIAGSCSAVIPARLHRYHSWHFGLRYLPTAPWETDGCGRLSMRSLSLPLSIITLRFKRLHAPHPPSCPLLWLDPLFQTTWPTPPTNAVPRPQCTTDHYLDLTFSPPLPSFTDHRGKEERLCIQSTW